MLDRRTDLAVEAHEMWRERPEKQTQLPGIIAREGSRNHCAVTRVEIINEEGAQALGKPVGTYVTVEVAGLSRGDPEVFRHCVQAVAGELDGLLTLTQKQTVLIVGLGNKDITPDAIGPLTHESIVVTRHLIDRLPEHFGHMRPVSSVLTGVLGNTGMEAAEMVKGILAQVKPDAVILVDALASRKLSRVCTTVQLSDSGIVPGSGVGNARAALNRETLGVPSFAVGVPTVVDAATVCADLMEASGQGEINPDILRRHSGGMIVTPKEIDRQVKDMARVVAYAINLCLHPALSVDDVTGFLS